jgi:hypothetical protein
MPSTAQFSLVALVTESLSHVTSQEGLEKVAGLVKDMDYATPETKDLLREIYRARQEDIGTKGEDAEAEEAAPS